ncbi:hypothetical protein O181_133936 [Austropuccinia psidii MF-1]|uniref:Integrase catalytic domain-containing protein n=1 Tax=Austropuccinia psidii MF-1 TaxID=1389203 RepID=A0A9Q3L8K2_9BASI|nr:hypothetical protein [Austropuccinia psidii MF-1]
MYVGYHQDDWNTWLPLAEFAYNNSDHSSTKQSPFFTVYGRDPQFDSAHITQDTVTTTSLTLLLDGSGNLTWIQVGTNWSRHIIYGQLTPLSVLWLLRHNPFQWPYPAVIGLLGLFPPHQPPCLHL